jgi:predicted Zn-dependent protease
MKHLFIRLSLLLCIFTAVLRGDTSRSSVLVVYDSGDAYALPCFEQIIVTLEYNRIPYFTYDLAAAAALPPLGKFMSIVTATEMLWKLDRGACDDLKEYVRAGGGLAVCYRGWNANLGDLIGIRNATPPIVTEKKGKGMRFTKEFIPGINGTKVSDQILSDISAYDIKTGPDVSVFATTCVDDLPAAWVNHYGDGCVLYWNCTLLSEKIYRGLIIPSLGAVQSVTVSPIMNLGVVCLDDFPNASPNVKIEPIKSEFNMTVSEFYAFRWYPDMLRLAQKYGLHYTAGLVFGYGENTVPPYTFREWAQSSITRGGKQLNAPIWITREAQKDIEIGFHGQNHQPLTLDNWKTTNNMELALTAAQLRWQYDNLGTAPVSYIPPMNIIDSSGMHALLDVFPTIRVIGAQYMGKFELGQNREFGTDPWNSKIESIPRVTSGFIYDDFNRLLTISLLNTVGAWTHFVHPDDIIPTAGRYAENTREDLSAENLAWLGGAKKTGLYYQFEKWIAFVKQYYPWLRYRDYAHSYDLAKTFESSAVIVKADEHALSMRFNAVPGYCVVHLGNDNRAVSIRGGEILHAVRLEYSSYYVIHVIKNDVVLALRDTVPTMLYQAGPPKNLYIAGNSRYSKSTVQGSVYPKTLASIPAVRASIQRSAPKVSQPEKTSIDEIALNEAMIEKNHDNVIAWQHLRDAYASNGNSPAVLRCDEHIAQLLPNDTAKTKALARQYVAMDKKEKAIPLYQSLLKRYPGDGQSWYSLYELLTWSERPGEAATALAGYVRTRPQDNGAMQKLAETYVANDRQIEAIPLYEKLVERQPDNQSLRKMLAQLYIWNNMHDKAARQYERLSEVQDADTTAAEKAIQEYTAAGETSEAVRMIGDMLVRNPGDAVRRKELIAIYRASGDNAAAIRQCEELLRKDQADLTVLKQLGEMYLWQERQINAIGIYERLVIAEPNSPALRLQLARLYSWNKRPADAALESRRILRQDPKNMEALRMVAETNRSEDDWFDARAWYNVIALNQPSDKDARDYLTAVRREHGLLFSSSYEWIDDSNDLTREELPIGVELLQTHTADYFLKLRRERVLDNRAHMSALGYGAGLGSRFALGKKTTFTLEALATSYDSNWVPITAKASLEHTFGERVSVALKVERSETVEGIQAIRNRLYTTTARGEFFCQATDRWSVSGLGEVESYTDDNLRSTGEVLTTYKIVMRQPQLTLQASSVYQDTKKIYQSSEPYWTPSRLFTNSAGMTISYAFFGWFTPEFTEGGTDQGGVFSNNFGAKATIQFSPFLQLVVDYGQVGSSVYRQNVARAALNFRY